MKYTLIFLFASLILFTTMVSGASTMVYPVAVSSSNDSVVAMPGTIYASTVLFQVETDVSATCKYSSSKGNSYSNMEHSFETSFETIHQQTLTTLFDGLHRYYVRCKDFNGVISGEVETTFRTNSLISATIELSEESPVTSGIYEITLTTSKIASQTPLLTYSYDGVTYNPIPLSGSGSEWTGYLIVDDDLREDVGSFRFQGRDLEGNLGMEILEGAVFIVDTMNPDVLRDLTIEATTSRVTLEWFSEKDEDSEEYNIYRSTEPGVDYSDYYRTTGGKTFSDTSVERGKTYYYRVSAVDEAGNEGGLSNEVFTSVLSSNTTVLATGLETRYVGFVDSFLSEIDLVVADAGAIKSNFDFKSEKEKTLFEDLKLSRDIDNAQSELSSLRREVENYKSQSLTKTELDKKLNSAQLKLNTIKRRIPENIIISSERTVQNQYSENDVSSALLALHTGIAQDVLGTTLRTSLSAMNDHSFDVSRVAYNVEIVYLDGSRSEAALVRELIDSSALENDNLTLVEIIPDEIAQSALDLDVKNTDYSVLKEDTILSFDLDSSVILYSLESHIDLDEIGKIQTLILAEPVEVVNVPLFTGYFSFVDFEEGGSYFGVLVAILVAFGLAGYFVVLRKNSRASESLLPFRKKILEAEQFVDANHFAEAHRLYELMLQNYRSLNKREKKLIYPHIATLHKKIQEGSKW